MRRLLLLELKQKTFVNGLLATAIVLLVAGCNIFGTGQSGRCEGSLTLEHPIPDTTVAVGDTLFIDLANPPVFVSSKSEISYAFEVLTGLSHVDLNRMENPNDGGNFSLLLIIGEAKGEARAELQANSSCLENSLTFNIIVTEP